MSKILLVDDSKTVNALVSKMLLENGFEVQSCYNGEDAMAMLKQDRFNLIITDIIMPGTDGVALIEHLHQALDDQTPGIIAMSGGSADTVNGETALSSVKHQADKLLRKPFSKDELLWAVGDLI